MMYRLSTILGALCTTLLCAAGSVASMPDVPQPIPFYSFDLQSPTVIAGTVGITAADILTGYGSDEHPTILVPGSYIGLGDDQDDLDALSFNQAALSTTTGFVFMFSVERDTRGNRLPSPFMQSNEVPFNVTDQFFRGQSAGDQYLSLMLYTRQGPAPIPEGTPPVRGNVLTVNNWDEGGNSGDGQPPTSSRDVSTAPQDNVDASAESGGDPFSQAESGVHLQPLYFSATSDSPSVTGIGVPLGDQLPGTGSGADVYYDPDPMTGGLHNETLFASPSSLGLVSADEIDALLVFDSNANGIFDGQDQVLLSLAPGSPSLSTSNGLPDVSSNGAAEVFSISYTGSAPLIAKLAASHDLGLDAAPDNVSSIKLVTCTDALQCGLESGIKFKKGDWDNSGTLGGSDYAGLGTCVQGPGGEPLPPELYPPPICIECFDFEADDDVDLSDVGIFQEALADEQQQ